MRPQNNTKIIEDRRMRRDYEASTENVLSDDDSFIQELESIPTQSLRQPNIRMDTTKVGVDFNCLKVKTSQKDEQQQHANIRLCCSPLLSPNEELTLLMVKNKPNAPDCNPNEEAAPSPPRSYNKRVTRTTGSATFKVPFPFQENGTNLSAPHVPVGTTVFMDPRTGEAVHGTLPTLATSSAPFGNQNTQSNSTNGSTTTTHEGPQNIAIQPEIMPLGYSEILSCPAARGDTKFSSNDSGTTATPSTLVRRIKEADEDIHEYTTNYLPGQQGLEVVPTCSTDSGTSHGPSVASSSYFEDLGDIGLAVSREQDIDIVARVNNSFSVRNTNIQSGSHSGSHLVEMSEAEGLDQDGHRGQVLFPVRRETSVHIPSNKTTSYSQKILDHIGSRSLWKTYGVICCLLVAVTVVLCVYFATRQTMGTKNEGSSMNIDCKNAKQLTNTTGGMVWGEILPSIGGNLDAECQVEQGDGYTLWYYIDGNGRRMSASTLAEKETLDSSDTQVLVFAGSCGNLECIGGSDQLSASHGSVGWFAETNRRYYVVVKGFRKSDEGVFTLTLDTLTENDTCDEATIIGLLESPVFGSTRNSKIDDLASQCEEDDANAPSSWFRFEGDGSVMCASILTEESLRPNFSVTLAIFEGQSCVDLSCKQKSFPSDEEPWITSGVSFVADEGTSYYAVVRGEKDEYEGDFVLDLHQTPPNGACETAEVLFVGSEPEKGTLINACHSKKSGCQGFLNQPGVWYTVEGTGELLVAQVIGLECSDDPTTRTQVSVFKGDERGCSTLQCVDFTSLECIAGSKKVTSQWFSHSADMYYILVQSFDASDFDILIEESIPIAPGNCSSTSTLAVGGVVTLGSTVFGSPAELGDCSSSGAKGVWYDVEGTGSVFEASTCNPGTNYSTSLTILSGVCGEQECVATKTITCDGQRSMAYWETLPGQKYSVYIEGQTQVDVGRFALSIKEGSLGAENDYCGSAEPLTVPSTTYGSTEYATEDDDYARMCGNEAAAPGVWYSIVGKGRPITASLCGAGTQYDTQIHVFAGSNCRQMACMSFNEDGCGVKSAISWDAIEGQLYFVLVSGFSNAVGDFELLVT